MLFKKLSSGKGNISSLTEDVAEHGGKPVGFEGERWAWVEIPLSFWSSHLRDRALVPLSFKCG